MNLHDIRGLAMEVADAVGAEPPELLRGDAPVLVDAELESAGAMYLVGLIGGKDVGKSALVNALAGSEISASTGWGPGTDRIIAYAHESQREPLAHLLDREAPAEYQIVTHRLDHLQRQVLLDLPDIDSHYESHVDLTRRMLRHLLFPIWMQSVEKYADRKARELLIAVAEGNAPANFIFCLNKADQLAARPEALADLRADFAGRLAEALHLPHPARVFVISALRPAEFDLPELRKMLSQQRGEEAVAASRHRAAVHQGSHLARWIGRQDLPARLAGVERVESETRNLLAERLGIPLIDAVVPGIMEDPGHRLALADEIMRKRAARWPIINVMHTLVWPALYLLRRRLSIEAPSAPQRADRLVEAHLARLPGGQSAGRCIAGSFALLRQLSPQIGTLYTDRKLWEDEPAAEAEGELRTALSAVVERQRQAMHERMSRAGGLWALMRFLLTFGAILWFPIGQPLLVSWLEERTIRGMILLAVKLAGTTYLLQNIAFLAIWFILLWMLIRWNTHRYVEKSLARFAADASPDSPTSLAAAIAGWIEGLLAPVTLRKRRLGELCARVETLPEPSAASRAA